MGNAKFYYLDMRILGRILSGNISRLRYMNTTGMILSLRRSCYSTVLSSQPRYIGMSTEMMEKALKGHVQLL